MIPTMRNPDDALLITIPDAARELQVSPITIRRMLRSGRLTAIRFSPTLVRIKREEIAKLIIDATV